MGIDSEINKDRKKLQINYSPKADIVGVNPDTDPDRSAVSARRVINS